MNMGLPGKSIPIIVEPLRLPEPEREPVAPPAPARPAEEPAPQR